MMGMMERIALAKGRAWRDEVRLEGRFRVVKYNKGESEPCETTPWEKNTITAEGLDALVKIIAGQSGTGTLDFADANLRIQTLAASGSGATFEGPIVSSGFTTATKSAPSAAYRWTAEDNTSSSYDASRVRLIRRGAEPPAVDPEYLEFNMLTPNWGLKPPSQNWHYEMVLELYSTNSAFTSAGLQRILSMLVGTIARANRLTQAQVRLQPMAASGSTTVGNAISPDAATAIVGNGRTLRWRFISPAVAGNAGNVGTWARTALRHLSPSSVDIRLGGCKQDGSSCGAKTSDEEWRYTYELTFSQGS